MDVLKRQGGLFIQGIFSQNKIDCPFHIPKMILRRKILVVLMLCGLYLSSQSKKEKFIEVYGYVIDSESREGVSFANIIEEGRLRGVTADVSGFFRIIVSPPVSLVFTRLGYKSKKFFVLDSMPSVLYLIEELEPQAINLKEVVILPWDNYYDFLKDIAKKDRFENLTAVAFSYKEEPVEGLMKIKESEYRKIEGRGLTPATIPFFRVLLRRK